MLPALEGILQDLRYGARGLRRNPGFALAAILAAALGIGASTAVFSAVDRILFRPLPYRDEARLASVGIMAPLDTNEFVPVVKLLVSTLVWCADWPLIKKVGSRFGTSLPADWMVNPLSTPLCPPLPPEDELPELPTDPAAASTPLDADENPASTPVGLKRSNWPALARSRSVSAWRRSEKR